MTPEPLDKQKIMKEKIIRQPLDESYRHEFLNFYVYLNDVKSAVDLVLDEIERRKKEIEEWRSAKTSGVSFSGIKDGWEYLEALRWFRDLIKRAFSGVIEE